MTTIDDLEFEFVSHATYRTGGERWEKCNYKGLDVYRLVFTRRNGESWGKSKVSYFIEKEKKEYKDVSELIKVINDRTSLIITHNESRP